MLLTTNAENCTLPSLRFYSGVFLVSLCVMALQVLQARIFSVTTWYHLAFLVISIAMFGMTLAALSVHRGNAEEQRKKYASLMSQGSSLFACCILVALVGQLMIPIVNSEWSTTLATLPVLSFLTVLPFYNAGYVLTLALTRAPFPVARTYGVDLIGAAAGCLAGLALMQFLDAPSAVMFCSILALAASWCFAPESASLLSKATALVVAGAMIANVTAPQHFIYPLWVKEYIVPQATLAHDEWNAISRVTVTTEKKDIAPFMWGPSEKTPKDARTSLYHLTIDGDAGTPISYFDGDKQKLGYLEYDVTTLAYAAPGIKKVGIIGVGGGRDVLTAHYFGAQDITALDLNNVQIALLTEKEPFKSYAGIAKLDGVKLIHSEARSWFSGNRDKFDLIQMSLIDTWAATGAGAFALSENGLYTTDGWKVFLEDLADHGLFTVSRWYRDESAGETERLLVLAAQSLFDLGVKSPRECMVLATAGDVATLIMSRTPLTKEQLAGLHQQSELRGFKILLAPDQESLPGIFQSILACKDSAELFQLANNHSLDLTAPTDDRPFFFNQVRLGNPLHVLQLMRERSGSGVLGQLQATFNLYGILLFALLMVVFTILLPLSFATAGSNRTYLASGTAWFMLIGLGFMLLEVALLQRMSTFIGHPSYGLGLVLFSLILAAGTGCLISEKLDMTTARLRNAWIVTTAGVAVLLAASMGPVFAMNAEAPLLMRAIVCVLLTVPLGILLGFGFPTGMALVKSIDEKPSAWFWGVNGAAGVMGSATAVVLNISLGLNWTILLGGLCYALLLLPSWQMARLLPKQAAASSTAA